MTAVTPLLKYPGGKRKVALAVLRGALEDLGVDARDARLIDPMCGAGSYPLAAQALGFRELSFWDGSPFTAAWWRATQHLAADHETIADACEEFHRGLLNCAARVAELGGVTYYRHLVDKANRHGDWEHMTLPELYAINRLGFNGLVRFNKSGEFNVPPGTHAKESRLPMPTEAAIYQHFAIAPRWRNARHYGKPQTPATVFILDPPYLGGFIGYTPRGWDADYLKECLGFWRTATREKTGPALLVVHEHTGGEAQEVVENYGGALWGTWNRAGTINCKPDRRTPRQEGVWFIRKEATP